MKENKIEILANEFGKGLGDAVLHICSPPEISIFKKELAIEEIENVEHEYFYLIMFLTTFACQIAFRKNQKLIGIILDSFHSYIAESRFNLPLEILKAQEEENELRNRYARYYELSRTEKDNIDFDFLTRQLPHDFFAILLKRDLKYIFNDKNFRERWGKSTILLSLRIGATLTEFSLAISRIKEKYKIEDNP